MPIVGSFAGASARAYGLGAGVNFRATGGTITTSGAYTIHTFLNSTENFVIQSGTKTVEYLVIAGGGGGSGSGAGSAAGNGGGGAGGYLTGSFSGTPQTYTITVGSGGTNGVGNPQSGTQG